MQTHSINIGNRQHGVVLIISLLILLVVTLLGVSTLRSTSMEDRMSANTQHLATTFQTTESMIHATMADNSRDDGVFADAISSGDTQNVTLTGYIPQQLNNNITGTATVVYLGGTIPVPGSSLGVIVGYPHDITSTATMSTTGANTTHRQGVGFLAPGS